MTHPLKELIDQARDILRYQYLEKLEAINRLEQLMLEDEYEPPDVKKKKPNVSEAVRLALFSGEHPTSMTKRQIVQFVSQIRGFEENSQLGNAIGAALTAMKKNGTVIHDRETGIYCPVVNESNGVLQHGS